MMNGFQSFNLDNLQPKSTDSKPLGQVGQSIELENTSFNNSSTPKSNIKSEHQVEHVNMTLPSGEMVRFNREWGGHRFTDEEVMGLTLGYDIIFDTNNRRGVCGSLDWDNYEGYDYFGFVPWSDEVYTIENAPFPKQWNGHTFSKDEEAELRKGNKLIVVCASKKTHSEYAVHVTFELSQYSSSSTGFNADSNTDDKRWMIIPHFEEFEMNAEEFTPDNCLFMPIFGGKRLTLEEIGWVRTGKSIPFKGESRNGRKYKCDLILDLDMYKGVRKWRLVPIF